MLVVRSVGSSQWYDGAEQVWTSYTCMKEEIQEEKGPRNSLNRVKIRKQIEKLTIALVIHKKKI